MEFKKRIGSQSPMKEWMIPLPANAAFVDVIQVYDLDKKPDDIEYRANVIGSHLKVDFMLEDFAGYIEYKYETNPDLDVDLPEWLHEIGHDHGHPGHDHEHIGTVTLEHDQVVIRINKEHL